MQHSRTEALRAAVNISIDRLYAFCGCLPQPLRRFAPAPLEPKGSLFGCVGNFKLYQITREKSRKTEGVFLVGSRRSGGKSKSLRARFLLPAFSFGEAKENAEGQSQIFNMRSLIIEFLLELCYNAVLYGKHIGLDEQSLVGLHSRDEILPVFKGIQPIFARAIDL